MRAVFLLALVGASLAVGHWAHANKPTPRRAREVHRATLKRPLVHAPARLTRPR
ncbi:MAG: hypothetical protein AMXMBFR34_09070 [Myxococcaceae bacterium]